jgi:putative endonuclease
VREAVTVLGSDGSDGSDGRARDLRNKALGAHGEALTARWYEARGYRVIERNWRCREGEIDLIVALANTVVFCEVKTRRSADYGLPAEAVDRRKQQKIRLTAAAWLRETGTRPTSMRFDVASVVQREVSVIEAAF